MCLLIYGYLAFDSVERRSYFDSSCGSLHGLGDTTPAVLNLPPAYLDLYAAYVYSRAKWIGTEADQKPAADHHEPPPLNLRIIYQSLEGESHEQKFVIEPSLYVLSPPPKNGSWGKAVDGEFWVRTDI